MAGEARRDLQGAMIAICLSANARTDLSVSAAAAQTAALDNGIYDVWCDVNVYLKVAATANDVTTSNGYLLRANTTIALYVPQGHKIGAIAGGAGTLSYHRTSWYAE